MHWSSWNEVSTFSIYKLYMQFLFISFPLYYFFLFMHRKLRNWMEDQTTQFAKEAKQKVLDARVKVIKH